MIFLIFWQLKHNSLKPKYRCYFMDGTDNITQFLAHYEDHFNILVCENFHNNQLELKQAANFNSSCKY